MFFEHSIQFQIFNFTEFILTFDLDGYMKCRSILPCNCKGSHFFQKIHAHIITGELKKIYKNILRKLTSKRPYAKNFLINFAKIRSDLDTSIESYCTKLVTLKFNF